MLAALAHPAMSQSSRWRADERVILTDFTFIQAVAVGRDVVYGATPSGLIVYDRRFRQWLPPVTRWDGYEPSAVNAALVSPVDESLWLGTERGLVQYRPQLRSMDRIEVPGGVSALVVDRNDPFAGLYFLAQSRWWVLRTGQVIPQEAGPMPPASGRITSERLETILQKFPAVDAMRASVLLAPYGSLHRYTSGAVSPEGNEVWLGSDGLGLVRYDPLMARADVMPFGLLSPSVGAVATLGDTVMAGPGPGSRRPAITTLAGNLQSTRHSMATRGEFRVVRDLQARDGGMWAASDRGVLQLTDRDEFIVHGPGSGLPSDNVLALAVAPAGVWAGTDRGLVLLDERPAPSGFGGVGIPISALAYSRDTLWAGTRQGLAYQAGPQGDLALVSADAGLEPDVEAELRRAVRAVAAWGDTLVVAGEEALLWRAGRRWTVERPIAMELGRLTALLAGEGGVWVGGEHGVGFLRFAGRSFTAYRVPDDVPGVVRDLGLTSGHLWVATENGLVRFSLDAIAP